MRVAASNAVQILTRDYMSGRDPNASSMRKEIHDRVPVAPSEQVRGIGLRGAIRLVADTLPSQDRINELFGGRHWVCEECGEFTISIEEPKRDGCKKKGGHNWKWLEDVGKVKYRCKNCGKELLARGCPQKIFRICPGPQDKPRQKDYMGREENFSHEWEKVGGR